MWTCYNEQSDIWRCQFWSINDRLQRDDNRYNNRYSQLVYDYFCCSNVTLDDNFLGLFGTLLLFLSFSQKETHIYSSSKETKCTYFICDSNQLRMHVTLHWTHSVVSYNKKIRRKKQET
jgi:hypothetical protein